MIAIPSHSSHLTQILDCSVFASLKKRYSLIPKYKNFSLRFTKNVMRIKKAYENSINSKLIETAWRSTGFKIDIVYGEASFYYFSEDFTLFLQIDALNQKMTFYSFSYYFNPI